MTDLEIREFNGDKLLPVRGFLLPQFLPKVLAELIHPLVNREDL